MEFFKAKQPKSIQKTVRIPREVYEWLAGEVGRVPGLTIPTAVVQLLEDAHRRYLAKLGSVEHPVGDRKPVGA